MPRELFGTDGVRGLAGEYPLDRKGSYQIGMAVGHHFATPGQSVIIGQDTRESSSQIADDVSAGLRAVGVSVVQVGVLPTPGLAYLTREGEQFKAGVMITASHNPYRYNGIKVFDENGDKLSDATEAILNTLIKDGVGEKEQGSIRTDDQLVQRYEDFLVNSAPGLQLDGLRLAVDTANGAACGLAARVMERLGGHVTALFDTPDGRNINAGCGATDTAMLAHRVVAENLALGIALDGDADRVIMIDSRGREVKGDQLLYVLAVATQQKGVVATVMSNLGFEQALTRHGIELKRTDVGDRYVLEGLAQTGYMLGGEQSGHIILPQLLATGDGLLAAVQTLQALQKSGKDLATWCDEVSLLPQALVNVPLVNREVLNAPEVQAFMETQAERFAEHGRLLIRPSGTEPVVRVMVEAENAQEIANEMAADLERVLDQASKNTVVLLPYPDSYDTELQPVPVEKMSEAGQQAVENLATKSYEVQAGITPEYADGISKLALEPSIQEYCPKDCSERFKDRQTTADWLSKGRAMYLLLQKGENGEMQLAGYGWVGAKTSSHVPGGETTFSLRIGEAHQGKGLATPFAVAMLAAAEVMYETPHMWLETWASNGGAVHVYKKMGFVTIEEVPAERPTRTGDKVADTRLFMTGGQDHEDNSHESS